MATKNIKRTFTITIEGRSSKNERVPINVDGKTFEESVKSDVYNWLNHNYGSVFGIPTFGYNDFVSVEVKEIKPTV